MATARLKRSLGAKACKVLANIPKYHQQYYAVKTFGGPSLHFHRRALGLCGHVSASDQAELIYAVLASWGMHRMGKGGSKMVPFDVFEKTVLTVRPRLAKGRKINPATMRESDWVLLEEVFRAIKVMDSKTTIVGNSKVMAHLLPNAIAPIDREYTLKFLFGNGSITNDLNKEWLLLRKIHEEFFYPIVNDPSFSKTAGQWIADQPKWPWDTSPLKVADNLVIGAMK
jgi:hypothetical protein